jgi:imidazolonepropionase-like amidohydrolase
MRSNPQRNGAGNKKSKYAWGIAFLMGVALSFARVGAREMRTVAITGGTVITMAGPVLKGGVVLIKDGKIAAVGTDVIIPAHAEIIDAKGKFVMPGIIDAMTTYGIRPQALNDRDNPLTPENRIIQAYYPFGEFMQGRGGIEKDREILSGGVTTVYIAPGDQQVIGGQGAVVKTWGETIDRMTLREPAAIDMAIGDPPLYDRRAGSAKPPVNRMGLATLIRKALLNTQAFIKKQKDYENQSADEKAKTLPPARDLSLEALSLLLKRQIPARVEADLIDDLRTACRLSEEWGFDLVIDSGLGAYKMKDILAKKKIPVVLGSPSNPFIQGGEVAMTAELYKEMNEYNAKELIEAGVKTAIGSFGFSFAIFGYATQSRWLLLEAAYLTGSGVSDEDALKMVTINAAEILGVDGRIGSLVAGKDADVIILNGYPLNIKTWVDQVFIDGQCVYVRQGGR